MVKLLHLSASFRGVYSKVVVTLLEHDTQGQEPRCRGHLNDGETMTCKVKSTIITIIIVIRAHG